ncbi:MAG: isochorismate synthase [Cytophagales bacterium]|nr:MAG: isochorismate synthase [Cytophagales bacterium]
MQTNELVQKELAIFSVTDQAKLLSAILYTAHYQKFPIAIWRLPEGSEFHVIIDFSTSQKRVKTDLEEMGSGFVVSPFSNGGGAWFIQADMYLSGTFEEATPARLSFSYESEQYLSEKNYRKNIFLKALNEVFSRSVIPQISLSAVPSAVHTEEVNFEETVAKAVQEIRNGTFRKVVLSRYKKATLPADFEIIPTFKKISASYPTAFVSLVSSSETGTWIGATPEILVSLDKDKIFRTMALAGTQAKGTQTNMSEVLWTQKEIEEQALVSRYIINCLKKIRVREFEEIGPKTVASGNLLHLRTDFEIDTNEINFPQLGTVMLELLHPTSAVCGMPKKEALDFIEANEQYDRSLYSGYLGQVNMGGESRLFVNLRCMQLFDKRAIVYAGAGITQDSNPQKEWQETEMKMDTMLRLI